jgi:hypothetical protein
MQPWYLLQQQRKKKKLLKKVFIGALFEGPSFLYCSIIKHLADAGKLKIGGGEYMPSTGKVEMIELPAMAKAKAH